RRGGGGAGGYGSGFQSSGDLAGPGANRAPVTEVPVGRVDNIDDQSLAKAQTVAIQFSGEHLMAACMREPRNLDNFGRSTLSRAVVIAHRAATEQPHGHGQQPGLMSL